MTSLGNGPNAAVVPPRATPLYFGLGEQEHFGWLHAPAGDPRNVAVVIVPPFGVEAVFAHRALRHIAEHLASEGFSALRYDHRDTGDSPGSGTTPGRVAAWTEGVATAVRTARELTGAAHVAIVGLRLGASLAAFSNAATHDATSLVLWAPVANGKQYARELRAFSRMGGSESGESAGGFALAPDTLAAMSDLNLLTLQTAPAQRVLVIPRDDLTDDGALASHLTSLGVAATTVSAPGYAASLVEPHNTEVPSSVANAIATWLGSEHPRSPRAATRGPAVRTTTELREQAGAVPLASVREQVRFLDAQQRLVGVLTEPVSGPTQGTTIVLVNAGAVSRVGPNRLYVSLAREWAAQGFSVVRMDIGGIGDSLPGPGLPENVTYPETAVPDVRTAVNTLHAERGGKYVVAGLCSGAHLAFHFALERATENLSGIVLLNPIAFYWKQGDALDVSAWQNYAATRWYKSRATSAEAWIRVIKGQVDLRGVAQTFARRALTLAAAGLGRVRARVLRKNGDLAQALTDLTDSGLDVFLAFSEGDPGFDQLRLLAGHALGPLSRKPNFHLASLSGADHTFTQLDAQRRLRLLLAEHLTGRFS